VVCFFEELGWTGFATPVGFHAMILAGGFLAAWWCVHLLLEARLAALRSDVGQQGRRFAWPRADWWHSLFRASYTEAGRPLLPWAWLSLLIGAAFTLWFFVSLAGVLNN
jgi:hypothetical protein